MRRAAKIDANQNMIVDSLRKLGYSVAITSSLGKGFPDLVVGGWPAFMMKNNFKMREQDGKPRNWLVELKDGSKPPSQRKLTQDEIKFIDSWRGSKVIVAHDLEGLLKQLV